MHHGSPDQGKKDDYHITGPLYRLCAMHGFLQLWVPFICICLLFLRILVAGLLSSVAQIQILCFLLLFWPHIISSFMSVKTATFDFKDLNVPFLSKELN